MPTIPLIRLRKMALRKRGFLASSVSHCSIGSVVSCFRLIRSITELHYEWGRPASDVSIRVSVNGFSRFSPHPAANRAHRDRRGQFKGWATRPGSSAPRGRESYLIERPGVETPGYCQTVPIRLARVARALRAGYPGPASNLAGLMNGKSRFLDTSSPLRGYRRLGMTNLEAIGAELADEGTCPYMSWLLISQGFDWIQIRCPHGGNHAADHSNDRQNHNRHNQNHGRDHQPYISSLGVRGERTIQSQAAHR
jgi:hypothetical protein